MRIINTKAGVAYYWQKNRS